MAAQYYDNEEAYFKNKAKYASYSVGGLLTLGLLWSSFTTLDETERGVDYTFGKITTENTSELRGPGISLKAPWTSVKKMRVDQQHLDISEMHTYTKDNQPITADVTVFYQLPESQLINICRNNPEWQDKLTKAGTSSVKSALGHTEAQNVAQNRDKIMQDVTKETQQEVQKLLGINVNQVLMPNYDFNDDFEKAVARSSNEKAALTQKQIQLEQSSVDAKKTLVQAQAKGDAQRIAADADAYSTKTRKSAEAEGFDQVQKIIGLQNMATYLTTNRWNGVGPVATGSVNVMDVKALAPKFKQ